MYGTLMWKVVWWDGERVQKTLIPTTVASSVDAARNFFKKKHPNAIVRTIALSV